MRARGLLLVALLLFGCFTFMQFNFVPTVHAAIVRVQGNARGTAVGSANHIHVTMGSPLTSGTVLVACVAVQCGMSNYAVSSISQTGVTWGASAESKRLYSGYVDVEIWLGVVGSGATSQEVLITMSASGFGGAVADICEYSGVATSSYLDKINNSAGLSTNPVTGTTATTTQASELWIGATGSYTASQSTPTVNSFTLYDGVHTGYVSLAMLEKIVEAIGTANSGTTASSSRWAGCIATFKAAAAGDTTKPTYSNISTNTTLAGQPCNFSVTLADETALANYTFGCNNTGTWANESAVTISGLSYKANTTKTLNNTVGIVIQWEVWFADSSNNLNNTGLQNVTATNTAPTNDACDSTATFSVAVDGWVNMTVSDANLVADLATVMIAVTAADSKTFNLTWTQATNTFAETLDASGICTLNSTSSTRVNVDSDTDKIAFLFQISVAAQSGACSVTATTTDDGALMDVDTYAAEFSIASYSVLTVLAGNSTHTWGNAISGTNDNLLDQGAIYFNVTSNFTFKIQAKGDGNLIKGSDYIALANVTIHEDTLGSSIPLTTSYADVGGLTSQSMGADLTLSLKVWLDSPANQPVGNYVYTLTLQITS